MPVRELFAGLGLAVKLDQDQMGGMTSRVMIRPVMTRRSRRRLRIGLVLILSLLFQQLAMAAYACTLTQMPPEPAAMAEHCADMGMAQQQDDPVLCEKHCYPDHSVAPDIVKLSVLPLVLPPAGFDPVLAQPVSHAVMQSGAPIARSDPPPRLRYCSLLI